MYQEAQSEAEDAEVIVKIFVQFDKSSGLKYFVSFSAISLSFHASGL